MKSDNDTSGTLTAEVETGGLYALTAAAVRPVGRPLRHLAGAFGRLERRHPVGRLQLGLRAAHAPPALGGDEPDVSLGYSSQSVDGRTASTNNQPSWAGEGFELNPSGYIERRYKPCHDSTARRPATCAGTRTTPRCPWATRPCELVKDATTKQWRPKRDDGTRIENLTGATERRQQRRVLAGHHGRRHPVLLRPEPPARLGHRQAGDQVGPDGAGVRQQQRRALLLQHPGQRLVPAGLPVEPRLRGGHRTATPSPTGTSARPTTTAAT